jgi:hypothetical protein
VALAHGPGHTKPIDISLDYYISIALTPAQPPGAPLDLGSFVFEGATFDVTDDMIFGNPSLDSADLPSHGIFETFFAEVPFKFSASDVQGGINTQDDPHTPNIDPSTSAKDLFFKEFEVDVSALDPSVQLHFDLYYWTTTVKKKSTETKLEAKAPFSHDAATAGRRVVVSSVIPEAASLIVWMLLIGCVGLGTKRRR